MSVPKLEFKYYSRYNPLFPTVVDISDAKLIIYNDDGTKLVNWVFRLYNRNGGKIGGIVYDNANKKYNYIKFTDNTYKGEIYADKKLLTVTDVDTMANAYYIKYKDAKAPIFSTVYSEFNNLIKQQTVKGGAKKRKSLDSCTVAELKSKCSKRGIKYSGLKKAELVAALRRK